MSYEELAKMQADGLNAEQGDLNLKDGIDCPVCKNKGRVFVADGNSVRYLVCSCVKKRQTVLRARRSQCGALLSVYRFDNYIAKEDWQRTVKAYAQRFAKGNDGAFIVGGCVGSGKTHICTAIVNQLINIGKEVRYWIWKDLATRLNQLVNADVYEYDKLIDEVSTVDVLYLDDFFKIHPTEAEKDKAFKIINARYNGTLAKQGFVTIISSEKTLRQIIAIDEAIGSRLKQISGDYSFDITGNKNWRLNN